MAIFGRMTARQRLRRATRESLAIPAFSSPIDCTPWVTGGLWPAELSTTDPETSSLAEYLKADLEHIARSANGELKLIKRSGLADHARQAEEARVVDEARARAERRVESTMRQLAAVIARGGTEQRQVAEPDLETTQVLPAGRHSVPVAGAPAEAPPERRWRAAEPRRHNGEPIENDSAEAADASPPIEDTQVIPAVTEAATVVDVPAAAAAEPERPAADSGPHDSAKPKREPPTPAATSDREPPIDRLNRLLEFVVRQEPRLNWAVGDAADGSTVVVTDLAHGWIPPRISLPAGVRLLDPGRRVGKASALIGEATLAATYAPGDLLRRSAYLVSTKSSVQPRELPAMDDLGEVLSAATRRRDGLPAMVHAMVSTAAAGTRIVDQEVDVLRVHLDTARYQLVAQYPKADAALLLNCLLLAAAEAFVVGDLVSANYHLRWFQTLAAPPPNPETARPIMN